MARKPITRTLPDLATLHASFAGFAPSENRVERITSLLRDTVIHVRQRHDTPFYSVRTVSSFFGIPNRTAHEAFRRLDADGLLRRVRGSQTWVRSHRLQSRHRVLGVVVVPVPLPAFVIGSLMRTFFLSLEQELRRRHFVLNFVFYKYAEEHSPELLERLLIHEPDVLFWHTPPPSVRPIVETLLDGGIPVVMVTEDVKGPFPRHQYDQDYRPALAGAFAQWRQAGITRFLMPCEMTRRHHDRFDLEMVARVLREMRLDHQVCELHADELPDRLRTWSRQPQAGIILTPHEWYESLCNRYPPLMEMLFTACRVLLVHGPLYHPGFQGRTIPADAIDFHPQQLAARIGQDLANPQVWRRCDCVGTFRMRYVPRVNLGAVSREV